jgi:hypothetical protein
MKAYRTFDAPWPAVLAELADFVALARLASGGHYAALTATVKLSRTVPAERLGSPEFLAFRAALESLPRCRVEFTAVDRPFHSVDIKIQE